MHIPDGFIDAKTAMATGVLAAVGLGMALRSVRRAVAPRRVPLIGLAAAFVFAAQMLNFPVAGGTSGHLIGAVLVVVLLGPSAAVLVLSAVLILQCFMFADGGVTALGANIFNMALVASGVGYSVYLVLCRAAGDSLRTRLFATAFASWCSTVAASISCAGQLALSGTVVWGAAFPAMTGIHILIGAVEALITTLVVAAVARVRPELLLERAQSDFQPRYGELTVYGFLVSIGLTVFVAPFACGWPDGLEKVAGILGVEHKTAARPIFSSPLSNYAIPGLPSSALSTVVAGCAGVVIAFILAWLLARPLTSQGNPGAGYQHRQSPIHRLPAAVKLVGAVAFVFIVVLLPKTAWSADAACGAALLLIAALSRIPAVQLAGKLLWAGPFALSVALLSLLQPDGLRIFAAMLVKSSLCLFCMVLLSSTTRFSDILRTLWRARVSSLFVTTLALMHRYLFLLVDEMERMLRARKSRSFARGRMAVWRSLATVVAHLFVRSSERAERIHAAMCARGWKT
ncbi:MAG: cobalt ECF transporter T component CbiQ [Verrucomicrobia bacterium]|nr:cobalt ECF transporter T component CbiQ [Verrucomicrobiota bacterium]